MSAAEFTDEELAIARRVVEREQRAGSRDDALLRDWDRLAAQGLSIAQAAERLGIGRHNIDHAIRARADQLQPEPPAADRARKPMSRIEGSCITGTGDATHVPLPKRNGVHHDPFAVINAAFEHARFVSPLDHKVHVALDDDPPEIDARFVAPALEEDEPDDLDDQAEPDVAVVPIPAPRPEPAMPKPTAPAAPVRPVRVSLPVQVAEAALSCCKGAPCGDVLTGGGAPRGWVLVRTIGGGLPRRYCGPFCAAAAIVTGPARLTSVPDPQPETSAVKREAKQSFTGKRSSSQIKARLANLGLTSKQVKTWALDHGLVDHIARGSVRNDLIEAYLAAHSRSTA